MNVYEELERMEAHLKAKGYTNATAYVQFDAVSASTCSVSYKDAMGERRYFYTYDNMPHDFAKLAFKRMWENLNELPTAYDSKKQAFHEQVAKMLDQARELGLETGLITPLEELVKKLSENIIVHYKNTDEIPF